MNNDNNVSENSEDENMSQLNNDRDLPGNIQSENNHDANVENEYVDVAANVQRQVEEQRKQAEYRAQLNQAQVNQEQLNQAQVNQAQSNQEQINQAQLNQESPSDIMTNQGVIEEANTLDDTVESTAVDVEGNLMFDKESHLAWPVEGNVLLNYSMDSTIYFPTLDCYKCNSAIIIQGDEGESVKAAANSYVEKVGNNDELGNYVIMNIGGGYKTIYGELADVKVEEGQVVNQGTEIGCVAEPSRYYAKEGYCVYFKLTKDEAPVDPLDFLDYDYED